uniref:Uncharacterized protein n=1 Tax=Anguilla anguilla TaxID=7936 RepID=A0A0E9R2D4_ANGAN
MTSMLLDGSEMWQ